MASLWIQNDRSEWEARPLAGETVLLGGPDAPLNVAAARAPSPGAAVFLRVVPGTIPPDWLLLTGPGAEITVNGVPERLGLRILAERDEIRLRDGRPMFFTAEERASVQPFPGSDRVAECPRCRQKILPGSPAVRCAGLNCGVWYHQSEELPCYTYSEKCARCPRKTALDAGPEWTPEES